MDAITEKDVCSYTIYAAHPSAATAQKIMTRAYTIAEPWIKDYIWQDQSFSLVQQQDFSVKGATRFGDCVEDEWFIVWILRTLSEQMTDIYVQVTDSDGEFLLIESAMHLPRWLDPEVAHNRAWILEGQFVIIKPIETEIASRALSHLCLSEALGCLSAGQRLLRDERIQSDAFSRIVAYPEQSGKEMHHVMCQLPRSTATVLHAHPAMIAPACVALCQQDPSQPIESVSLSTFTSHDLVEMRVNFTRTLYAQITGHRFRPPDTYQLPGARATNFKMAELGCKVSCALELLTRQAQFAETIAQVLRSDLITDATLASLPTTIDSDDYLDVNFEEIEQNLAGSTKASGPGAESNPETVQKMISQIQKFMTAESGFEGAEFSDEDDESDSQEELDQEEDMEDGDDDDDNDLMNDDGFMDFLRSSMNARPDMRSQKAAEAPDESDGSTDGEIEDYMAEMDAELAYTAVGRERSSALDKGKQRETRDTTPRDHTSNDNNAIDDDNKSNDGDEDEDLMINYELAKNLMESIKLQSAGEGSGPAANLLGRMGVFLPRDDDQEEDGDASREKTQTRKKENVEVVDQDELD